jgi:hypothetical protein
LAFCDGNLGGAIAIGVYIMLGGKKGKRERSLFEPGPSQKQQTGLSQGKKGSKQKSRKAK